MRPAVYTCIRHADEQVMFSQPDRQKDRQRDRGEDSHEEGPCVDAIELGVFEEIVGHKANGQKSH